MSKRNELADNTGLQEVVVTRVFDAPRELVFKMWTDPQYLARWWGPKGFTNPVCEIDVREGGRIRIVMKAADGSEIPTGGCFREVLEPERLVFVSIKEDAQGNAEMEVLNTVTFSETDGRTRLTLKVVVIKSAPEGITPCPGMKEGWSQSLDRLAENIWELVANK